MKQYWFGMHCECDWKMGSPWKLVYADGRTADAGEVVESDPPKRLALKWRNEWNPEMKAEGYSRCTFDLEPVTGAVKLTVTHVMDRAPSKLIWAVSGAGQRFSPISNHCLKPERLPSSRRWAPNETRARNTWRQRRILYMTAREGGTNDRIDDRQNQIVSDTILSCALTRKRTLDRERSVL